MSLDQNAEPAIDDLERLYHDFASHDLIPLWTQTADLMPMVPRSQAVVHMWRWSDLYPLAHRAGDLVPERRGGERRAIALANPGLPNLPFATPTLWVAIQFLGSHEESREHWHSQNAFRFIVEGDGVWTLVNGDPVAMTRGDLLLTPGWNFHSHHNSMDQPMAWIDGLDIPFQQYAAYRWEHTDRALTEQLALEDEGHVATVEPGHAAVRYRNPTNGGDIMPTICAEFHRLRPQIQTRTRREIGSSVWQVFEGTGTLVVDEKAYAVERGDLVVVPSWSSFQIQADSPLDLFRFTDQPIVERLDLGRTMVLEDDADSSVSVRANK